MWYKYNTTITLLRCNRGTVIIVRRIFFVGENHRVRCICNIYTTNTAVVFFDIGLTNTDILNWHRFWIGSQCNCFRMGEIYSNLNVSVMGVAAEL